MKLFLVSQTENNDLDTYDSFVVAAESEEVARNTIPAYAKWDDDYPSWCSSHDKATVQYLGEAADGITGIVCASFNAG